MFIYELTAKELRDKFLSGEISAEEIVNSFYERIEKIEDKVKSFVSLRKELALEEAKKLDEKRKNGEKLGKLAGIPLASRTVDTLYCSVPYYRASNRFACDSVYRDYYQWFCSSGVSLTGVAIQLCERDNDSYL